jgi:ABC-type lipoprotein release transport system permease subunit
MIRKKKGKSGGEMDAFGVLMIFIMVGAGIAWYLIRIAIMNGTRKLFKDCIRCIVCDRC